MKLTNLSPLLIALSLATTASVRAASTTWTNAGTDFNDAANWSDGLPGAADTAVFFGPVGMQPELSADITINSLTFSEPDSSGYQLTGGGGSLTVNSVGVGAASAIYSGNTSGLNVIGADVVLGGAAGSTMSVTQVAGGTLAITGNISSLNALGALRIEAPTPTGTVILSGSNSYAGNTIVEGNNRTALHINSANAISSGRLVLVSAATIDNTSGAAISLADNNDIDLGGTLAFVGSNDLDFGSGVLRVTAASQSTVNVVAGVLKVGSLDANAAGKSLRKIGGGTLVISGEAGANLSGGFTLGSGTVVIGHGKALGTGDVTVTGGATLAALTDLGGADGIANNIIMGGNLVVAGSHDLGISGMISQSGGNRIVDITNSGITTLSNMANSYTGATRVQGVGSVLEVVKLADGGLASSIGASSGDGGNLLLGDGTTLRYIGAGDSTDRSFRISGSAGAVATVDASGSGAIHFTNSGGLSHSSSNQSRTLNLTGANQDDNSMAFALANNGTGQLSVTKNGTGKWILSGANTYTGATTVNAGTLVIQGTISNSSVVTVQGGGEFRYNSATVRTGAIVLNGSGNDSRAVLSGTGTINAALLLDDLGDTLSPGNSPGVQVFGVSQSWNSFTYVWETNNFMGLTAGVDFDQISILGALTLDAGGSYQLDLRSLTAANLAGDVANFAETERSWVILTTTSGITGFEASSWNILTDGFTSAPSWQGVWSLAQVGNDLVLSYAAVPEPSTVGLLAAGLAASLSARRLRS